ncbi:uncharacterized protein LOC135400377 [Ornithodoros turicata]|uniref:uncharacterized protein LOC135400377 n=1 Tax=Ornithodoros turicata TaxID=34597 RepID=UPI0031398AF9
MTTGAVLYAGLEQPGEKRNCFFCSAADHSTEDCKADFTLAERFKKLAKGMRCYRCTKKGHRSKDCRVKVECSKCRRRHASSVCDPSRQPVENALVSEVVTTTSVSTTNNPQQCERARVMLQTFRAWASSDSECAYLRGIFDGGSQRTFIRNDIARRLKLPLIGQTTLQLNTFAGDASRDNILKCKVVEVRLRSQFAPKEYVVRATTIDFICKDLEETPASNEFVSSVRVHGNFIADDLLFPNVRSEGEIGLLIGCDELWKLVSGEVKRCKSDGRLVAVESVFGWTFQGPTTVTSYSTTDSSTTAVCILKVGVGTSDDDILKRFWELDNLGISQEPDSKQEHNAEVLEDFIQKLERRNGRYEVALPWKMGLSALEDTQAEIWNGTISKWFNELVPLWLLSHSGPTLVMVLLWSHLPSGPMGDQFVKPLQNGTTLEWDHFKVVYWTGPTLSVPRSEWDQLKVEPASRWAHLNWNQWN